MIGRQRDGDDPGAKDQDGDRDPQGQGDHRSVAAGGGGAVPSAKPRQAVTGSCGYFGKAGFSLESRQKEKLEPRVLATTR